MPVIEKAKQEEVSIVEKIYNADQNEVVKKSNWLIGAKQDYTLLECQLMMMALKRAAKNDKGEIVGQLTINEIKSYMPNWDDHHSYECVKEAAERMMNCLIIIEEGGRKGFMYINLVTKSYYKNGTLSIKFNPELEELVYKISSNYTPLNIKEMCLLKTDFSFRLYELLKSQCYNKNIISSSVNKKEYSVVYDIGELRMLLGAVDINCAEIRKILRKKEKNGTINYDELLQEISETPKLRNKTNGVRYESWREFKRKILDPSIAEINEIMDIIIAYKTKTAGRAGKTKDIEFSIRKKTCQNL